jgi:hypothetical protein
MAATQRQPASFRPLTPSWSFCDVKPLQPHQLACSSAGVQISLPSSLGPSCGPSRHHAAPVAILWPLPPSCGSCCHQWSFRDVKPLQPLQLACSSAGVHLSFRWGPCHHHAAPAAIMWSLQPSCGHCRRHAAPCRHHAALAASVPAPLLGPPWPTGMLNHCNPFSWPVLQLGCIYLFAGALATIMRLLPPSCGPCSHHAAIAAVMQHPAAIMRPLLPQSQHLCLVRRGQPGC